MLGGLRLGLRCAGVSFAPIALRGGSCAGTNGARRQALSLSGDAFLQKFGLAQGERKQSRLLFDRQHQGPVARGDPELRSPVLRFEPEINSASSGAGTCPKNMTTSGEYGLG